MCDNILYSQINHATAIMIIFMHAKVLPDKNKYSANFYLVKITERFSVCSGVNWLCMCLL